MKTSYKIIFVLAAGITATAAVGQNSPYIKKVHAFVPAPGQYVNELPEYEAGDQQSDMNRKCEDYLVGTAKGGMVSLGAYGGYIIFSFDHAVQNVPDKYDFKIYGNATNSDQASDGGSSEPGIVYVCYDANGNGLPDDEWYELAGSDYYKTTTLYNYIQTYYKPDPSRPLKADPDPEMSVIIDRTYIRWTSNNTENPEGYVQRNSYHTQSYWPQWITDATLVLGGTRLSPNAYQKNGSNNYWVQQFLEWGYTDNKPNDQDPGYKLEWAVDSKGNPVNIPCAHFIKVQTGISQNCGHLGETSTEIMGAEDLHPETGVTQVTQTGRGLIFNGVTNKSLQITNCNSATPAVIYDPAGRSMLTLALDEGYGVYDLSTLDRGVYILVAGSETLKFAL